MRGIDLRTQLVRLFRLGLLGGLLWIPRIGAAQEAPVAKAATGADPAALVAFAELLTAREPAEGVVLARATGEDDSNHGRWGHCGKRAVKGWVVFETIATVTGVSPGPRFVAVDACPRTDFRRPGLHLVAWRKTLGPRFFTTYGPLRNVPAGLPVVSSEDSYAFDGAVVATPRPQAGSKCPHPLPEGQTWADYQVLATTLGDPPETSFALVLPCPVPSGTIQILWRRDPPSSFEFLAMPPLKKRLPTAIPVIYLEAQREAKPR